MGVMGCVHCQRLTNKLQVGKLSLHVNMSHLEVECKECAPPQCLQELRKRHAAQVCSSAVTGRGQCARMLGCIGGTCSGPESGCSEACSRLCLAQQAGDDVEILQHGEEGRQSQLAPDTVMVMGVGVWMVLMLLVAVGGTTAVRMIGRLPRIDA